MLLVSVSTLNQSSIVVCRDRSDDEFPNLYTPKLLLNSPTSGNTFSNTHSDLRGGYEADHSDTSDGIPNADNINDTDGYNNTIRAEANAGINNHMEGYYSAKDGRPLNHLESKKAAYQVLDFILRVRKESRAR